MQRRESVEDQPFKIRVAQLDSVNKRVPLSSIIERLVAEFRSIIGIARVFDYQHNLPENVVFLYLMNGIEFNQLMEVGQLLLEGRIVKVSSPDVVMTSAQYPASFEELNTPDNAAHPWSIALHKMNISLREPTADMISILQTFEARGTVTGLILGYEPRRRIARDFGFVLFNKYDQVRALIGTSVRIRDRQVVIRAPKAAPVLIAKHGYESLLNSNHTEDGRLIWSGAVKAANWLNTNLAEVDVRFLQANRPLVTAPHQRGENQPATAVIIRRRHREEVPRRRRHGRNRESRPRPQRRRSVSSQDRERGNSLQRNHRLRNERRDESPRRDPRDHRERPTKRNNRTPHVEGSNKRRRR
jgi:hypothetical protein